jgi:hypothetical protein
MLPTGWGEAWALGSLLGSRLLSPWSFSFTLGLLAGSPSYQSLPADRKKPRPLKIALKYHQKLNSPKICDCDSEGHHISFLKT